jgi:hypothetical protein
MYCLLFDTTHLLWDLEIRILHQIPIMQVGNHLSRTQNHPIRPHMHPIPTPYAPPVRAHARTRGLRHARKCANASRWAQDGPELTQDAMFERCPTQNRSVQTPKVP